MWCKHSHTQDRNNASIWSICRLAAIPIRSQPEVEMTNTIRQQIHHPCALTVIVLGPCRSPPVKNTRDAPLTEMTSAPVTCIYTRHLLYLLWHTFNLAKGPQRRWTVPYVGGRLVNAGRCGCNLDLDRGGETRGWILFNKKACFVLLLNVNVRRTRAS